MAIERISATRYGVRYGRRLRDQIGKIERARKDSLLCPYCHYKKVDRLASGLWNCKKCKAKFTDNAYSLGPREERILPEVEQTEQIYKDKSESTKKEAPVLENG